MKNLLPFFVLVFSVSVFGQRSISDLDLRHRNALDNYLKTRAGVSLRLETILDRKYLDYMSETLGTGFRPNYAVGDFNRDKKTDFAVLLSRPGKPKNQNPEDGSQSSEHFPDFPMVLIVFNGGPGLTFKPAFTMDFFGPRASFIHFDKSGRRLYFGIFETDSDTFSLMPRGSGYRVKSEAL